MTKIYFIGIGKAAASIIDAVYGWTGDCLPLYDESENVTRNRGAFLINKGCDFPSGVEYNRDHLVSVNPDTDEDVENLKAKLGKYVKDKDSLVMIVASPGDENLNIYKMVAQCIRDMHSGKVYMTHCIVGVDGDKSVCQRTISHHFDIISNLYDYGEVVIPFSYTAVKNLIEPTHDNCLDLEDVHIIIAKWLQIFIHPFHNCTRPTATFKNFYKSMVPFKNIAVLKPSFGTRLEDPITMLNCRECPVFKQGDLCLNTNFFDSEDESDEKIVAVYKVTVPGCNYETIIKQSSVENMYTNYKDNVFVVMSTYDSCGSVEIQIDLANSNTVTNLLKSYMDAFVYMANNNIQQEDESESACSQKVQDVKSKYDLIKVRYDALNDAGESY
jgi:hypothetical protein